MPDPLTDPVPDPLAAALDRLWRTNGPELRARAERVRAALTDSGGATGDQAGAVRDAHVLAGALGTYGRPGSELFATAEALLARELPDDDPGARVALAAEIQRLLPDLA